MTAPTPAQSVSRPSVPYPLVETTNGKVLGIADRDVLTFKGLRYAATTAGANRFLPPRPPAKWAGVKEAFEWGASAPQAPTANQRNPFYSWYMAVGPTSEDCLFLNVFTPGLGDGGGKGKRPVMVWLHGGGWRVCTGGSPAWDGSNLARAQDVVVVTVNHRLNGFGYFPFDESDERFADAGNAGLLDLVMALAWVRDNAAAFGGDPRNVTIFGQSGGAAKVAALLAMPAAKGLFHKAIVQSTSGGMRILGPEEAARIRSDMSRVLNVSRVKGEDLQKLSPEALLAAFEKTPATFRPLLDGRNCLVDPYYPGAPAIAVDVPLLAGTTDTETTWYYATHPQNFSVEYPAVKQRLMRFLKLEDSAVDALIETYRSAYSAGNACDILTAITTDYLFKRNTMKIASLQSASARAPVYSYVFARETPVDNGRFRSPHASEIPFIFGTTGIAEAFSGKGGDIAPMTDMMMATWTAFARCGNPSNSLIPEWKPFNDKDRATMILNMESRLESDAGGSARAVLEGLPYYEYSNDRATFVKD